MGTVKKMVSVGDLLEMWNHQDESLTKGYHPTRSEIEEYAEKHGFEVIIHTDTIEYKANQLVAKDDIESFNTFTITFVSNGIKLYITKDPSYTNGSVFPSSKQELTNETVKDYWIKSDKPGTLYLYETSVGQYDFSQEISNDR